MRGIQPCETEQVRNAARGESIVYWKSPSKQPDRRRARRPQTPPGQCYTKDSYPRAIARGCDAAVPPPAALARREEETLAKWAARLEADDLTARLKAWRKKHRWHPHQLRHAAATRIERELGKEAARAALGHRSINTTEIYIDRDIAEAIRTARKIG